MKPPNGPDAQARRTAVLVSLGVVAALVGACRSGGADPSLEPELRPAPTSIDEAVQRRLDDAGLEATLAGDSELCRRLFGDLIGRFATADEVASECVGQDPQTVAARLQAREEYVALGQRHFRDRIGSSDTLLHWPDLIPAYEVVAQMLRGEIDYEQFAIGLMAEPGLLALDTDPLSRAYRVHRVFLGGEATEAMAQDLARLTRIWDVRPFKAPTFPESGGIILEVPRAYIVAGHCGLLGDCATDLYPGGRIEFPDPGPRPLVGIKYEHISDAQKASLRGLGEHVVTLPRFWEAAADEVLDRLLGWSDGGVEPRRPGRILPEVRNLVVEHLQQTKDIRSAERLVIGSLLYTQTHRLSEPEDLDAQGEQPDPQDPSAPDADAGGGVEASGRPVWASGPLKFTPAEVVLNTALGTSVPEQTCDPRTGDDDIYRQNKLGFFLELADQTNGDVVAEYNAFITELHDDQGNWRPLVEQEVVHPEDPQRTAVALDLDSAYFDVARAFGGCPGVGSPRLTALDGLAYAFGQEVAANLVCERPEIEALVGDGAPAAEVAAALVPRLFGRAATPDELTLVSDLACDGSVCSTAELTRGVCVAMLGAHEMLFY